MKTNKTISIDMDLIPSLNKLGLNVSEYCNEKLWDYVTQMNPNNNGLPSVKELEEEKEVIEKRKEDLEKKEKEIDIAKELKSKMEAEGITEEKQRFLKAMNSNVLMAKDNKIAWENKFGEMLNWSDLLALKRKWG